VEGNLSIPDNAYIVPIQLRFVDTDLAGHVNHANFISYLETARVEWIKFVSREQQTDLIDIPLIIARVDIDYLSPIHLHHQPKVALWVDHIGTKSFSFSYLVFEGSPQQDPTIFARATTIQVYFDYSVQKSIPIPERERDVLAQFLVIAEAQ